MICVRGSSIQIRDIKRAASDLFAARWAWARVGP